MNLSKLYLYRVIISSVLVVFMSGVVFCDEGIDAQRSIQLLKDGNERFVQMKLQHPNENIAQRENTAKNGQKPFAIVLACSDSRVPVETIFDRGIGDIFVVRIAGNVAMDSSVIGSVEYAAEHLNSPLLIVLGHTDCGAVKSALLDVNLKGKVCDIQKKIKPIAVRTKKQYPELKDSDLVNAVVKNNIINTKNDLLARSHEIKKMVNEKKLQIITAIYNINTGKIEWFE